jgi:hypothetical protein
MQISKAKKGSFLILLLTLSLAFVSSINMIELNTSSFSSAEIEDHLGIQSDSSEMNELESEINDDFFLDTNMLLTIVFPQFFFYSQQQVNRLLFRFVTPPPQSL